MIDLDPFFSNGANNYCGPCGIVGSAKEMIKIFVTLIQNKLVNDNTIEMKMVGLVAQPFIKWGIFGGKLHLCTSLLF